jgi:hypothetical protein
MSATRFVRRTRQIDYFRTVTVETGHIGDDKSLHHSVELVASEGPGMGLPISLTAEDARWVAAALTQAADYIEREEAKE